MRFESPTRATALFFVLAALLLSGCGSDDDNGSKSGAGAPPGATGTEAGGAAVEAGKQRDPEDVEQEKENFSEEPPPVQLQTGDKSGFKVDEPTAVVAQSNKELRSLTKRLYSNGVPKEDVPPVDFKTRQAVAVMMPSQPKGTLMQITDIHEEGGKIQISIVRLLPGKDCPVGDYRPNPYSLVETRKMKGEPVIKVENVRGSAC